MRLRLIAVFLAISTMVAMAFVVPLGFLVRRTAEDRAIDSARADAAAVVPALAADGSRVQIESAVGATRAGREGRMSVRTWQGWTIGPLVESPRVELALATGQSAIGEVDTGVEVVAAVASGPGELSAIRVFVAEGELHRGQWTAWAALGAVGISLVGMSVLVADRLARSIVRPTQSLAAAAQRLGEGDLEARVEADGPQELAELSATFNQLGRRISGMLERERELVADLSHRLRTPLTKLWMRIDQIDDQDLARQLRLDVQDVTGELNSLIEEARDSYGARRHCDAGDITTQRADFWSVLAEDQGRPMRFERGSGPLPVAVSESDLGAAIDVLIENVFAHTNVGAPLTIGFGLRADQAEGMARIWVEDGGPGFQPDVVERGASAGGSTGLGLDIARRMAEQVDGHLQIGDSELGGAFVALCLPLVADTAPGPE